MRDFHYSKYFLALLERTEVFSAGFIYERIKLFFMNQEETVDVWQDFNFNSIEKIFKTGLIYACPYRTQNGRSLDRISKIIL